jgi:hypothetical protein
MCALLPAVINICRSFLIEEKCRFLSNFSLQTAEVELPGEFLLPKVWQMCVLLGRIIWMVACIVFTY